jgi:hypothetical protein
MKRTHFLAAAQRRANLGPRLRAIRKLALAPPQRVNDVC